jgi:hypothetical protein
MGALRVVLEVDPVFCVACRASATPVVNYVEPHRGTAGIQTPVDWLLYEYSYRSEDQPPKVRQLFLCGKCSAPTEPRVRVVQRDPVR